LDTTSVGVSESTCWPPEGDCVVGAESAGATTTAAAACVNVIVDPATVRVPVRAAPVFAATVNCTVPFPVPEAPWAIVMKVEPLVAVQAHPDAAVTGILPVAPAAAIEALNWPIVITHAADGCVVVFEQAPANSAVAAERQAATHLFTLRRAGEWRMGSNSSADARLDGSTICTLSLKDLVVESRSGTIPA
jgi:hypothetical protein